MANTQAMCTSFKVEILNGIHALGTSVVRAGTTPDSFKAALYLVTATGAVGSVAAPRTLAISGNEALGEAGDLAVDRTSEITGVGAAGSIGTRRYLLGEDGNKLRLEDGSGFLLVEAGLTASGGQDVIDVVSGGGYGLRRIYHRTNRVISQREMVVAEIIYAVAKQQIDHPSISESARLEQLSSVMAARGVEVESLHAESLAAERNRLISMEVARLLKIRADQEDEALLMILAEAV